ncbi:MAG: caspase family protein [Cyclobacteriaceae bacterium]|nr:caspase family protein [Cyclobacteriaceae bacterium]MCX7637893.1 caspase family protein [Cyclobacteriaceae bacterium]MDW8332385.1 caspase family protein [Cyclobacteriaceae bacterium]
MQKLVIPVLMLLTCIGFISVQAQNMTAKTNKVSVDFSNPKSDSHSSFPKIVWINPANETVFQKDGKFDFKFSIESRDPLVKVTVNVREKDNNVTLRGGPNASAQGAIRGSQFIDIKESDKYSLTADRSIKLVDGVNEVEIIAENAQGVKSSSSRFIHVGETLVADAAKLDRTDYALVIVTDKYDNWPKLTNPVFDGRTITRELESAYGFKVDLVENPSQDQIWAKLREYAEKKYKPLDQLFIFIAGHGHFDDTFKEGYLVVKESLLNDAGNSSYISHNRLRNNINSIPCEHIFLVMDVCFGGTFDDAIASSRGATDPYKEVSQSEFITRKLAYKTRKYLTSGGKEYVSDGTPGHHSPFASRIVAALRSRGGNDGILSLNELLTYVEKLNPEPRFGKFGNDAPGSEFVFVVK